MRTRGRRGGRWPLVVVLATLAASWAGVIVLSVTEAGATVAHARAAAAGSGGDKDVYVDVAFGSGFSPAQVKIKTGTTVVWRNQDSVDYPVVKGQHQIVADDGSFASPQVEPGSSWAFRFLKPGKYPYHCGDHFNETGTVVVTGPPISEQEAQKEQDIDIVEPNPNDQNTWGFKPSDITVEVGTKVTWRNTGRMEHSVTSDDGTFDSGLLRSGSSFTYTFNKPGVFDYHCKPHPWMQGTVRVAAPGKAPPPDTHHGSGEPSSAPPPPPPPTTTSGGGPSTHYVNIVEGSSSNDWGFDPSTVQVGVGDTVDWKNTGTMEHSVTDSGGSFDSGLIKPGGTFAHTFDAVGTFQYHCTPHPWMTGTVVVSKTAPAQGKSSKARPASGPSSPQRPRASGGGPQGVAAAPVLASATDPRLFALLAVGALTLACTALLVGRWWGELIPKSQGSS